MSRRSQKITKFSLLHWTVSPFNPQSMGGLEVVEASLLKHLSLEFSATLYTHSIPNDGVNLKKLWHWQPLKKYDLIYYLHFALRARDSDIWLGFNTPLLSAIFPAKTITIFQNFITVGNHQAFLPLYSLLRSRYQQSQYIFCSSYLREAFHKLYPDFPRSATQTIFNAVDTPKFSRLDSGFSAIKKLVFIGQRNQLKGFDLFVDAVSLLRKQRQDFEVHLIGGSTLWNSKKVGSSAELEGSYVIDHGILSHDDSLALLEDMDVMIVPSRWNEPFGNVAVEGLAAGVIVISSGRGGLADSIEDQKTGFVLSNLDVETLSNTISNILDLPKSRISDIRRNGYQKVLNQFTWEIYLTRLQTAIKRIRPI